MGQQKPVHSSEPSLPLEFGDQTGLKRFLDSDIKAPMSSLLATACKNQDKRWSCEASLVDGAKIKMDEQQSADFVIKHLFSKKPDLLFKMTRFELSFLGCLDKRGATRCRIEGMADKTEK
ncbi:MAG: hypothetical protein AAF202_11105 [Pseudomonadota bacterium]